MTKKDYIAAAHLLNGDAMQAFRTSDRILDRHVEYATRVFVALFRGDNPRFDTDRFLDAVYAGLPEKVRS